MAWVRAYASPSCAGSLFFSARSLSHHLAQLTSIRAVAPNFIWSRFVGLLLGCPRRCASMRVSDNCLCCLPPPPKILGTTGAILMRKFCVDSIDTYPSPPGAYFFQKSFEPSQNFVSENPPVNKRRLTQFVGNFGQRGRNISLGRAFRALIVGPSSHF